MRVLLPRYFLSSTTMPTESESMRLAGIQRPNVADARDGITRHQ
jgi:hypothetical protein